MEENMEPTQISDASEDGGRARLTAQAFSRIAAFVQNVFNVLVLMLVVLYFLNRAQSGADEKNVFLVNSVVIGLLWMSLAIAISAAYAKHVLGRE
jgi:ABC-type transport system involved in cytochrome bd biosynthesis fused ATPase/permease subunit